MADQQEQYLDTKMHYSRITFNKRLRLIEMVEHKHYSIYKAAKQLKLSNSTAKLIIKKYREEGRVFRKKQDQHVGLISKKGKPEEPIENDEPTLLKEQQQEIIKAQDREDFKSLVRQIMALNNIWVTLNMEFMMIQ